MAKYLILDCSLNTKYAELFMTSLSSQIHPYHWDIIQLLGEGRMTIPSYEIVSSLYEGVIITGSHHSVNDETQDYWSFDLIRLVQYSAMHGKPKIFGGCYGAQIIAKALGGEVAKNPTMKFLLQPEFVQLNSHAILNFFPFIKLTYSLIESHGEYISKLPSNAILLASSPSCPHELYLTGAKNNILGCQSHPEFNVSYALSDASDLFLTDSHRQEAEELFESFTSNDSQEFISNILLKFLVSPVLNELESPQVDGEREGTGISNL
jgi:GMP synthase-like glutamine amidotransferase